MTSWTVDADDIHFAEEFDQGLLHHTPGVDEFLERGATKFLVLGTKGLGKTLLLKAKRIGYEDRMLCLPRNALIDKPIGDKIFSAEMLRVFGTSTENWKKVWLMSIAVAALKALDQTAGLEVCPRLHKLFEDRNLVSVIDHFVNILDLPRSELFRCASDTDKHLMPRLRNTVQSVAVFIDSVDEYFNKHLQHLSPADAGELSPDIWYFSQMGLVEAAYQLRRLTHHVKVFAAIRKEAFERFGESNPMVQQFRGSTVDMQYSRESLREIFVANIRREHPRFLVDRTQAKHSPFVAFLGLTHVRNALTGDEEEIFDYIYRHTMGRPRDLMSIGGRLSRIPTGQRDEDAIKAAVNAGGTEIAQEYLNEIAPFVEGLHIETVFKLLHRNVLTAKEAGSLGRRYRKQRGHVAGRRALDLLYGAGLIGFVETNHVTGAKVQRFLRPGQVNLHGLVRLPPSTHYLVHPVLAELVSRTNGKYVDRAERANVVGDGRPWKPIERQVCVLRADIKSFSEIMDSPGEAEVRERFAAAIRSHTVECLRSEIEGGDSVTIVHDDPHGIIKAAKRIMQDLFEAPGRPELRVAIDRGCVELSDDGDSLLRSTPFRVAARLEPHVRPSQIWVTESFREALGEQAFYDAVPVDAESAEDAALRVNLRKQGSDERDEWIPVYQIVERSR